MKDGQEATRDTLVAGLSPRRRNDREMRKRMRRRTREGGGNNERGLRMGRNRDSAIR